MKKTTAIKVSLEIQNPDWNLLFGNEPIYKEYVTLLKSHYANALMDFDKEGALRIEGILGGLVTSFENRKEEQKAKDKSAVTEVIENLVEEKAGQQT